MTDEDHKRHFDEVISLLAHNRRVAGGPSYQTIDKISSDLEAEQRLVCGIRVIRVPRSTAHNVFSRTWSRIPRWELVESLWATLYRHAEAKRRGIGKMFSLADLQARYRDVETASAEAADLPQPAPQPVATAHDGRDDRTGAETLLSALDWDAYINAPQRAAAAVAAGVPGRRYMREVDGDFVAELSARSRHAFWRDYRDVIPDWFELYVMAEPELAEIRTYAPLCVPSLLQTGEYARLVIARDLPEISERELQRRVELRLSRQSILFRPDAPKLWIIIHERVLREDTGSAPIIQAQIRHLIALAARPNITLQVMPTAQANAAFMDGPITVMRFPESHINDMIFLEHRDHALYLVRNRDLTYFGQLFSTFLVTALPPDESIRFLHNLL
ncbi:DUF5753 domain-containing protein [Actinomadura sp. 3N508]|uniref:DUF5753 domain-containing protein n=1 Tax=Actinomadura sp. 3N508 TaxID=3375153 RepID=UPI0037B2E71F